MFDAKDMMCTFKPQARKILNSLRLDQEWRPRKSMKKCWIFKTKTFLTTLNRSPPTSRAQSATVLTRDWSWQLPSLETPSQSKKCSRELPNYSLLFKIKAFLMTEAESKINDLVLNITISRCHCWRRKGIWWRWWSQIIFKSHLSLNYRFIIINKKYLINFF